MITSAKVPITKAILLVGGKGTRLAPLTDSTPKPMLKVAGKPVTEHQVVKAREAGITHLVLATSYLAEVFQPYFGDGSRFGLSITYAIEEVPLGTGGAIANAAAHLDLTPNESVVIFNGDVLSGHDLNAYPLTLKGEYLSFLRKWRIQSQTLLMPVAIFLKRAPSR